MEGNPAIFFHYTFHYTPSYAAAVAAAVCFFVVAVLTSASVARHVNRKQGWYMTIIPITAVVELLGYDMRIATIIEAKLVPYITSTLFLLTAPIALAAVNYIVAGKLLRASGKSVGCIKANTLARLYLISDIVCFFVQAGGGGLLASKDMNMVNMGLSTMQFGLGLQMVIFTSFIGITIYMQRSAKFALGAVAEVRPVFHGLYVTSALLFVRNLYRLLEFSMGNDGYFITNEWVFYTLETVPILLSFVAYAWWNFDRLLTPEVVAIVSKSCGNVALPSAASAEQAAPGSAGTYQGAAGAETVVHVTSWPAGKPIATSNPATAARGIVGATSPHAAPTISLGV
jgi:hypothetical protein